MLIATRLTLLTVCLCFSAPAFAGTINFTDGRGAWQSTQCQKPMPPNGLSQNPETAANDLNSQWDMHNSFVQAAQSYMNCISNEAQRDGDATAQIVTRTAQNAIQQMQNDVAASAARLQHQQPQQLMMQQPMTQQPMTMGAP